MSQDKPREFWIKITQFENVGMGGFRYSDAEISIDPNCGYNYEDFKNAIHVVEMSALAEAQAELEKYKKLCEMMREALSILEDKVEFTTFYKGRKLTSTTEVIDKALAAYDAAINPPPNLNTYPESEEESY